MHIGIAWPPLAEPNSSSYLCKTIAPKLKLAQPGPHVVPETLNFGYCPRSVTVGYSNIHHMDI